MITTVLALFTLAASLGEEPPLILSAHRTYAECQNAKQKLLHEKYKELQKNVTFPACLRVVFEDAREGTSQNELVKTNDSSDETKGAGSENIKEEKGSGE